MRNRYQVLAKAEAAGVPVKKQLKTWDASGKLIVLEVDRPLDEILDELESRSPS